MAIVATTLTESNSTANGTTFTTASVTPTASSVLLAFISHTAVTPPVTLVGTCSSGTATLFPLACAFLDGYSGASRSRVLEVWAGVAPSATAGAFVFDFLGTNTQTGACWAIVNCTGTGLAANTNTALRSILRATSWKQATAVATGLTVTMPNPRAAGNASIFAFAHASNEVTTPGAGLTEISDQTNADAGGFEVAWVNAAQSTGAGSWATGSACAGLGVEVAVAGNTAFSTTPEATLYA